MRRAYRSNVFARGDILRLYPSDGGAPELWQHQGGGWDALLTPVCEDGRKLIGYATIWTLSDEGPLYYVSGKEKIMPVKPLSDRPCDLVLTDEGRDMIMSRPHTPIEVPGDREYTRKNCDALPLAVVAEAYGIKRKAMKRRLDAYRIPYLPTTRGVHIDRVVALDMAAHAGRGCRRD